MATETLAAALARSNLTGAAVADPLLVAYNKLTLATKQYATYEREEQAARNSATDARNVLNEAQKAFDKEVEKLKATASKNSDWMQHARIVQRVAE